MNIHENTALLDAYLDNALSAEETAAVAAHLETCPDCRAYIEDALAMRAAFPTCDEVELPAQFAETVIAAVAKTPQSQPKKQPWGKLIAAAACLAVIVLVQHNAASTPAEAGARGISSAAVYSMDSGAAQTVPVERSMVLPADSSSAPTVICDTAEETEGTAESAPLADSADSWVEGPDGNVRFCCTVFLSESFVGSALDGYESKPYSTTSEPEKGVIGQGYALEQETFAHILYDVLSCPMEAPQTEYTTELCCIVVTPD